VRKEGGREEKKRKENKGMPTKTLWFMKVLCGLGKRCLRALKLLDARAQLTVDDVGSGFYGYNLYGASGASSVTTGYIMGKCLGLSSPVISIFSGGVFADWHDWLDKTKASMRCNSLETLPRR
jgi:hypothetical protein